MDNVLTLVTTDEILIDPKTGPLPVGDFSVKIIDKVSGLVVSESFVSEAVIDAPGGFALTVVDPGQYQAQVQRMQVDKITPIGDAVLSDVIEVLPKTIKIPKKIAISLILT